MNKAELKKMSKEELTEFIRQNRLFTQKELARYFNVTLSIMTNELVKRKMSLVKIKREEMTKYLRQYPLVRLAEVSNKFGVNEVTVARLKKNLGLVGLHYVDYNNFSNEKLKRIYKKSYGSIRKIVRLYGGTQRKWKELLIKRGIYSKEISKKYLKQGYAEKFRQELKKRGESLLYAKPETIAKLVGCSVSYAQKMLDKYKKEKK